MLGIILLKEVDLDPYTALLRLFSSWDQGSFEECIQYWFSSDTKSPIFSSVFLLGVWRHRNMHFFEDVQFNSDRVCASFCGMYNEFYRNNEIKVPKSIATPSFQGYVPIGFFDGASQLGNCRAGMLISVNATHRYFLRMGCGAGSNT